jgi:glycosyltransferase involved in cell wall biosynthesis
MTEPLVSIITPTFGRAAFLPLIYACVKQQRWSCLEWLVEDDSPEPSQFMQRLREPWIIYRHTARRHSVGYKRNTLVARAKGQYIAHFDDDDYYSPRYVSHMMDLLLSHRADICKLSGFFLLHHKLDTFAYWDLLVKTGIHFVWTDTSIKSHFLRDQDNAHLANTHYGYGFSYVYKKSIWCGSGFPDLNWNEDVTFVHAAGQDISIKMIPDQIGLCLHLVHDESTSKCFPQFLLPRFLLDHLFSEAGEYLEGIRLKT